MKIQTFPAKQLATPLVSSTDILHVHTKTDWTGSHNIMFSFKKIATVLSPVDK